MLCGGMLRCGMFFLQNHSMLCLQPACFVAVKCYLTKTFWRNALWMECMLFGNKLRVSEWLMVSDYVLQIVMLSFSNGDCLEE